MEDTTTPDGDAAGSPFSADAVVIEPAAKQVSDCPATMANDYITSLIAIFVLLDLFTIPIVAGGPPMNEVGAILYAGAVCFLASQFALIAAWGALSSRPLYLRLPISILGAGLLYVVSALGTAGVHMSEIEEAFVLVASTMLVPLAILFLQAPIWLVRSLLEWVRLDEAGNELTSARQSRQFALQDMLVLTAAVAVALGLAQGFIQVLMAVDDTPEGEMTMMVLAILFYPIFLSVVFALFITLPCLTACFVVRHIKAGMGGLALYAGTWCLVIMGIAARSGASGEVLFYAFLSTWTVFGVPLATTATVFSIVRSDGYRLIRRRRQPVGGPAARTGCPFAGGEVVAAEEVFDPFAEKAALALPGETSDESPR